MRYLVSTKNNHSQGNEKPTRLLGSLNAECVDMQAKSPSTEHRVLREFVREYRAIRSSVPLTGWKPIPPEPRLCRTPDEVPAYVGQVAGRAFALPALKAYIPPFSNNLRKWYAYTVSFATIATPSLQVQPVRQPVPLLVLSGRCPLQLFHRRRIRQS